MTDRKQTRVSSINTKTAPVSDARVKDTTAAEAQLRDELHSSMESLWGALGMKFQFKPESTIMVTLKFISRITLYAFGFVAALYITSWLSMILVGAGWPLFLVAVIEITSLVCGAIASWLASDRLVNYVAAGGVSRDIKRVGGWLKGRFDGVSTYAKQRMAMH